jgi:hypothetical protein
MGATAYRVIMLAALLALLFPLTLTELPPLGDFPDHLARGYALAHLADDPALSKVYEAQWGLIPNVAIDLVIPPLLSVVPVFAAGRIVLTMALFLPVIGTIACHRARFGRRSLWPIASVLVACNGAFILGFVNFLISLGVALIGAAAWIRWSDRRPMLAALATAAAAFLVFFLHAFGSLFLCLLIACDGLARAVRQRRNGVAGLLAATRRLAPALPAVVVPGGLYLESRLHETQGGVTWPSLRFELTWLFGPFLNYHLSLDMLTGLLVVAFLIACARARWLDAAADGLLALVTLIVLFAAAPLNMKNAGFIDTRFSVAAGFLLFAAVAPRIPRPRLAALATLTFAGLFVLRMTIVAAAWSAGNRDLADLRRVLRVIPASSMVLVTTSDSGDDPARWRAIPISRVASAGRTFTHLPALMVIERHAIPQILYTDPAKQPLIVRPAYRGFLPAQSPPPPTRWLRATELTANQRYSAPYLVNWPKNFDFVLALCPPAPPEISALNPEHLQLVVWTDIAAVLRIRH